MDSSENSQGDDNSYQDPSYYEGIGASLMDSENPYDSEQKSPLREQDRFLPIANVAKIMKKSVPYSGKIAKEAKECVQECVSEFISFITSEAVERCINEKRKTVNGEDILFAINNLGFDNYVEPLKKFLLKYREASKMDTTIFDESSLIAANPLTGPGGQMVIFSTPVALQQVANQPGSTPIAARPITVVQAPSSTEGTHLVSTDTNGSAITIGGHQFTQQIILAPSNGELGGAGTMIKQEEDIKFTTNQQGTIILPFSGQVSLVNNVPTMSTATSIPTTVTVSTVPTSSN